MIGLYTRERMMAKGVSASKKVTSVPQPARADFVYGTYPPAPRIENTQRVKPGKASERNYGKKDASTTIPPSFR